MLLFIKVVCASTLLSATAENWATLAPLITPRLEHGAASLHPGGASFPAFPLFDVIMVGGSKVEQADFNHNKGFIRAVNAGQPGLLNSTEIYDSSKNKWSSGPPMIAARGSHATAVQVVKDAA
jgi:hypothetical protein